MKTFKYVLISILCSQCLAFGNYNDIYVADIQYDWIDKTQVEKESIISEVHDLIFENGVEQTKSIKSEFSNILRDKEYKEHYLAASAGYKEYKDYNISAFYAKNKKYIYMYALQDKKDISKAYYYDALGHLRYVDFIEGEYPDYPYTALQYSVSGKLISAIYYVSKDNQYLYNPDGTFKGVWYKHNLYDRASKIILKRTAY